MTAGTTETFHLGKPNLSAPKRTGALEGLRTRAIVNPHSRGNRTAGAWRRIEARLRDTIGPVEVVFTGGPMDARRLALEALREGVGQIIAIGGDGTVNEVVNGFFEDGRPVNPDAVLAALTSGTGQDFRRTFGMPEALEAQIDVLAACDARPVDIGKLVYTNADGGKEERYFDNVASFGLSGATAASVNRLKYAKWFGGRVAFKWGMLKALLRHENRRVRVQVDDFFDETLKISTVAVCNGRFFGGGMRIAPNAAPDDGRFDIVIIGDISLPRLLWNVNSIYRGKHLDKKEVHVLRGGHVAAMPVEGSGDLLLDVDGEAPGRLPATFDIIPGSIRFRGWLGRRPSP